MQTYSRQKPQCYGVHACITEHAECPAIQLYREGAMTTLQETGE